MKIKKIFSILVMSIIGSTALMALEFNSLEEMLDYFEGGVQKMTKRNQEMDSEMRQISLNVQTTIDEVMFYEALFTLEKELFYGMNALLKAQFKTLIEIKEVLYKKKSQIVFPKSICELVVHMYGGVSYNPSTTSIDEVIERLDSSITNMVLPKRSGDVSNHIIDSWADFKPSFERFKIVVDQYYELAIQWDKIEQDLNREIELLDNLLNKIKEDSKIDL